MARLGIAWALISFAAACAADKSGAGAAAPAAPAPCPASWLAAPAVDPSIAVPDGGGAVVAHGLAKGTQNYTCKRSGDGPDAGYAWAPAGPEAELGDCVSAVMGKHFASDAGPTAPEWQGAGGDYVIGHKVSAFSPDKASVAWLLLAADHNGGSGPLARAKYIQRVGTHGGNAPVTGCDAQTAGVTQKVEYSADYYFFGD